MYCLQFWPSIPTFDLSPYNVLCTLLCSPTLHNVFHTRVHGERKHESLVFKNKLKYLYLFSGMCKKCGNVIFVNEYHDMKVNSRHRSKSLYALNLGTKWRCVIHEKCLMYWFSDNELISHILLFLVGFSFAATHLLFIGWIYGPIGPTDTQIRP
jgi:hypothetical protein